MEGETSDSATKSDIDRIFPLVYGELRRIAHRQRRAVVDAAVDTTMLVHEAYLKLLKSPEVAKVEREHFFGIAARAMRQILVDQARRRNFRRASGQVTLTTGLYDLVPSNAGASVDIVALDRALHALTEMDARCGQAVELRVFGGLEVKEIAQLQGVTPRTVARDWRRACAFLIRELNLQVPEPADPDDD